MCLSQKIQSKNDLTAVILCGGQSRRMGGIDKGLIAFNQQPMVAMVAREIAPIVGKILISANQNQARYQKFGAVIADKLADFQGPLAGISAALSTTKTAYLLVVPCDAPRLKTALVTRLIATINQTQNHKNSALCVATIGTTMQPTFAIIHVDLAQNLDDFLSQGKRQLGAWMLDNNATRVDFSDHKNWFSNINSPEDLRTNGR